MSQDRGCLILEARFHFSDRKLCFYCLKVDGSRVFELRIFRLGKCDLVRGSCIFACNLRSAMIEIISFELLVFTE